MDVNFRKRKKRTISRIGNLIWSNLTETFYTSSKDLSVSEGVSKNTVDWVLNNKKILPSKRRYQKVKIFNKDNLEIYSTLQEASKETRLTTAEIYDDIFNKRKLFDYVMPPKMGVAKMIEDWKNRGLLKEEEIGIK